MEREHGLYMYLVCCTASEALRLYSRLRASRAPRIIGCLSTLLNCTAAHTYTLFAHCHRRLEPSTTRRILACYMRTEGGTIAPSWLEHTSPVREEVDFTGQKQARILLATVCVAAGYVWTEIWNRNAKLEQKKSFFRYSFLGVGTLTHRLPSRLGAARTILFEGLEFRAERYFGEGVRAVFPSNFELCANWTLNSGGCSDFGRQDSHSKEGAAWRRWEH